MVSQLTNSEGVFAFVSAHNPSFYEENETSEMPFEKRSVLSIERDL